MSQPFVTAICTAALCLAAIPRAQQTTPKATPSAAAAKKVVTIIVPFAEDAAWKYRFTNKDNKKTPVMTCELRCLRRVKVGKTGDTCWEMTWRQHKYLSYQYRDERKDGLYLFHNSMLGGRRGVSRQEPRLMLPLPVGVTAKWKWTEQGSVQTMGSGRGPDPKTLRMHYSAEIEDYGAEVKVPAGTYKALRVVMHMKSEYMGDSKQTFWYAPKVGMVKRVDHGRKDRADNVYELTEYTPGAKLAEKAAATVTKFLATDPFSLGKPAGVAELEQPGLESGFRSRFFLVRWAKKDVRFVRAFRGKAVAFDPQKVADWQHLVKDEDVTLLRGPAEPGTAQQSAEDITKAYGVLTAYVRDPDLKGKIRSRAPKTEYSFRDKHRTVHGTAQVRSGKKWKKYKQKVSFKQGKIESLWTDAVDSKEK